MKLGLLSVILGDQPLLDVARWAAAEGFEQLEVACWPAAGGAKRRYAGVCHLDVDGLEPARAQEVVAELAETGITISSLGYYPNPLHPDPEHRAEVHAHLRKLIDASSMMGIGLVTTFVGADQRKTVDENLAEYRRVFPELLRYAADHGVRVAIENCPMIFSYDEWPSGHNLAYSPRIWEQMFDAVDGDPTIGLNLDPSHLVWQMIDIDRVVRDFGSRIYHVHAKDLQIDREGLYRNGIMSAGMGWQVPRLPGLGEVDWRRFVSGLYRTGYDGVVCVEHEDRDFEGSEELVKRGLLLARNTLRPLIA
jgi:sugar phosphate isomerase/epimerase